MGESAGLVGWGGGEVSGGRSREWTCEEGGIGMDFRRARWSVGWSVGTRRDYLFGRQCERESSARRECETRRETRATIRRRLPSPVKRRTLDYTCTVLEPTSHCALTDRLTLLTYQPTDGMNLHARKRQDASTQHNDCIRTTLIDHHVYVWMYGLSSCTAQ